MLGSYSCSLGPEPWRSPLRRGLHASVRIPPRKTVVFSRSADDPLRVLIHFSVIVFFQGIFVLRLHITTANLDGVQFIGTDAPEKDFLEPTLVSKIHFPALFTSGIGSGQSSLPTEMMARLEFLGSMATSFFRGLLLQMQCIILVWTGSSEETKSSPSGPRISFRAGASKFSVA